MNSTLSAEVSLVDAIYRRRAVRRYTSRDVTAEIARTLLLAAAQAPSAMNQQPWAFGVFHGRRRLLDYSNRAKEHLVATYPATFEVHARSVLYEDAKYDVFHGAPLLIVIYATSGRLQPNEDCCLAAQNLMLAAYGLGLGTCPIGFARPWLDLPETKRELDVPEHYAAVFPVVVGYPDGTPEPASRQEPAILNWKWDDIECQGISGGL
jgi:nitroreductase